MKQKGVFFCGSVDTVNRVYSEEQQKKLAELCDFRKEVVLPANFANTDLRDIEVIFSTWGMLKLSEAEIAEKLPNLKAVFYAAGATDAFCRPFLNRGIHVFSAWQANAIPVAEFAVAQILLSLKNTFQLMRNYKNPEFRKNSYRGTGCYGRTVTLIGAGAISNRMQDMLKSYALKVQVVPSRPERRTISLEQAFADSQVVSNHLPDRDDNVGVITGKMLESMPEGAVFINTGRGRQVNEPEMIAALKKRPDLTALLDVTFPEPPVADSELYTLPNVFLTPHIAGSLGDEVHRMSDYMIEEFQRFAAGEAPLYEVSESMLLTSK